jgi:hypothetical protein
MAKLNFYKLIWDEAIFRGLKSDPEFKRFIFQIVNEDEGKRDFYALEVYGRRNDDSNYPGTISPGSLQVSNTEPNYVPVSKKVVLGSIKMSKDQLAAVSPKKFKYIKFEAEPKEEYITYNVFAVDENEVPITYANSPSEIYDHEIDFNAGQGIVEERLGKRRFVKAIVNPRPPPP